MRQASLLRTKIMGMAENTEYRIEHDTMGEVRVPVDALYRAQTQRAVENFPISGQTLEPAHIRALALIKKAAAKANEELGVLDAERSTAIQKAADLVAAGEYDAHFPSMCSRPVLALRQI